MIGVLKSLQHSTRFLQHCCSHSKVTKDINLINHVPQLKRSLEMLLFRVKVREEQSVVVEGEWDVREGGMLRRSSGWWRVGGM